MAVLKKHDQTCMLQMCSMAGQPAVSQNNHALLSFLNRIPHVEQQLVLRVSCMPHGCNAGVSLGQLGVPGSQRISGSCQLLLQLTCLQQQALCAQQSVFSSEMKSHAL